jgi:phosphoribosyl 1,2-cyclic phosphodiesterase
MIGKPLYWADNENVYGVFSLSKILPITLEQFSTLSNKHCITEGERETWWEDAHKLYAHEFKIFERFKTPQPHEYHRGIQVFFDTPVWKAADEFTVAFDLDNTIADTNREQQIPMAYIEAKPLPLAKESLEELHDKVRIIIHTARDPRYYELTTHWLQKHGIVYDELIMGKPVADYYVGDAEVNFNNNWRDIVDLVSEAASIDHEDKQDTTPANSAGDSMNPLPHQAATRTVRTLFTKSLTVENGEVVEKASLPLANKPAHRYYDLEELPQKVKYQKVLLETKFDGMDVMVSKEKVWSGRGLDKSSRVPFILEELDQSKHSSFTLHGQAMMYHGAEPGHRTEAISYLNSSAPVEEGKELRIILFDVIELDGENLRDTPMLERLETLRREFSNSEHVKVIDSSQFKVVSRAQVAEAAKDLGDQPGSEGAMIFDSESKWTSRPINFAWSKWKKQQEIDVLVVGKERKENGYSYLAAIGPLNEDAASSLPKMKVAEARGKKWLVLGHTHISDVDVSENDVLRVRVLEVRKYGQYDYGFMNAVPMYPPEKSVPDGLDVASRLAVETHKSPYSPFKCMNCEQPPTVDVLWAEGMGRVWFCDKHFEKWKNETTTLEYGGEKHTFTHESDISKVYKVKGEVPQHWHDHTLHLKYKSDEDVEKQFASDPDSGAPTLMPGRTSEGVRTTSGMPEGSSAYSPIIGRNPALDKLRNVDAYNPKEASDKALLDDHRIVHAWWSTLQSGKPLRYDKVTIDRLHADIVREMTRRKLEHHTDLKKSGGYTVGPAGEVGVSSMGAGERSPDGDKTFHETAPVVEVQPEKGPRKVSSSDAKTLGTQIGINWDEVDLTQFQMGLEVEFEHGRKDPQTNVTNDDPVATGKIAWAHLKEDSKYYSKLRQVEAKTIRLSDSVNTIKFLGTSGAKTFPRMDYDDKQCTEDHRAHSSILYQSKTTNLLVDVGNEDVWKRAGDKVDAVAITHGHVDHFYGLPFVKEDVPIYMHRDTWRDIKREAPNIFTSLSKREVHLYGTRNAIKIGDIRVRWIPVKHSDRIGSYALRLNRETVYSPDFLQIDNEWLTDVKRWIIDGASMTKDVERESESGERNGHQSIESSLRQAKKNGISRVIVTHVGHTGLQHEEMSKAIAALAEQLKLEAEVTLAYDGYVSEDEEKSLEKAEMPTPADGEPYSAQYYKGEKWLHDKAYAYIIHHHFPYGPLVDKDGIKEGTAGEVKITGPAPAEAGGKPPSNAESAPRDLKAAEEYVKRGLKLEKEEEEDDDGDKALQKGEGGLREHWETRQDTGASTAIGWTLLAYPWTHAQRFFSGSAKALATAKLSIPKTHSKKFPRGWFDVQGIRRPIALGGETSAHRSGFYEILEEDTFRYGIQRDNVHEYFFSGRLLHGRYVFRLLQLSSGTSRWLAFRPNDQKPADPVEHQDTGYWKLKGEGEASVQSPREERGNIK